MSKNKSGRYAKLIKDYVQERDKYISCTAKIKAILEELLIANQIRFQAVGSRTKSIDSFTKKVQSGTPSIKEFHEMQDLSACRIIFYLESDANRFVKTIHEEFEVIREDNRISANNYNAYHMLVKLKLPRTQLPEYIDFQDQQCEIQLTTVLFHAWSEQNHDLVYKDADNLSSFDPAGFDALKAELEGIMKDYIKVATRKFEVVNRKAQRIRQGKRVFDTGFLNRIPTLTSNDEIFDNLRLIEQYIGEFQEDKTPEDINIVQLLMAVMDRAKENIVQTQESVFGAVAGKTRVDIVLKCIDIMNKGMLKYNHFEEVFNCFLVLQKDRHPAVKKQTTDAIKNLVRYDYHVIKQVNYYFQQETIAQIEKIRTRASIRANFQSLITALEALLSTEIAGESYDPSTQSLTIRQGGLGVTKELKKIRSSSIDSLKSIYMIMTSVAARKKVVYVLSRATVLPNIDKYSEELTEMVITDANTILDFYLISVVPDATCAILLEMEEDCAWLFNRFGTKNLNKLEEITKELSKNKEYQIYRTLCGYAGKLATKRTWQEEGQQIQKNISKYVQGINSGNTEAWIARIGSIAQDFEPGGRILIHLQSFLQDLAKDKPEFALKLISQEEEELSQLIQPLLQGLLSSVKNGDAKVLIENWVSKGKHLYDCGVSLRGSHADIQLLDKVLDSAIKNSDKAGAVAVIGSVVFSYDELSRVDAKKLAIRAIKFLNKLNISYWVSHVWYMKTLKQLLTDLAPEETDLLLDCFMPIQNLDNEIEDILTVIAEKNPLKVILFFRKRISKQTKSKGVQYTAIPYHLDDLGVVLKAKSDVVIDEILEWFEEKNPLYHWEATRLLAGIFPYLDEPLKSKLLEVINQGDEQQIINVVIGVTRNYQGKPIILDICRAAIIKVGKPIYSSVTASLSHTGFVSGEYGLVNAYKQKKQEIEVWKSDSNSLVKNFYRQYTKFLDGRIEYEQKQSDDDIEFLRAGL